MHIYLSIVVILLVCPYVRAHAQWGSAMNLIKLLYLCGMLKSVLDNSGSRQGRDSINPTCHEAMTVQKNVQLLISITIKKTTLSIVSSLVGPISSHFPHSFFFLPLFFSPFPPFPLLSSPTFSPLFISPSHTPYRTFLFHRSWLVKY